MAIEPAGRDLLDDIAILDRPGFDDLRTGLEVKLNAVLAPTGNARPLLVRTTSFRLRSASLASSATK